MTLYSFKQALGINRLVSVVTFLTLLCVVITTPIAANEKNVIDTTSRVGQINDAQIMLVGFFVNDNEVANIDVLEKEKKRYIPFDLRLTISILILFLTETV